MASAIEEEIFINLIGEHKQVMLDSQVGNSPQLIKMKDLTRRIARCIDDDSAGTGCDRTAQSIEVKLPVRCGKRDRDRLHLEREQCIDVITVERLEEDDLVAWIQQRKTGSIQRPRGSRGHQHLGIRVGRDAVVSLEFSRDCLSQRLNTVQPRVDVVALMDGLDRRIRYEIRQVGIAYSLREIDAADTIAFDRHGTNLRLNNKRRNITDVELAVGNRHIAS